MEQTIIPTKSNLLAAKNTLDMAKLGYDLLDRKRNVLIREIMELNQKAKDIQGRINSTFSGAYEALQRVNISMGMAEVLRLGLNIEVDNSVRVRERSVMGVIIPNATLEKNTNEAPPFRLMNTSSSLDAALIKFKLVKELIVELSMVENAAYRLAVAIKKAQKRANALKNVLIPKYEEIVKSISETLEERERDEFTRLKVIKNTTNA